jgi:hypothetical protein
MEAIVEHWRPVPGYERGYEVSSLGEVRSLLRGCRLLKPATNRYGYKQVVLYKDKKPKGHSVHRLVAAAFVPNPEKLPWVNHRNGVKHDNKVENLEWCTRSENARHAAVSGLMRPQRGEANGNCSFSDREWRVVSRLSEIGFSQYAIAEMFGTSQGTICNLLKQKREASHDR